MGDEDAAAAADEDEPLSGDLTTPEVVNPPESEAVEAEPDPEPDLEPPVLEAEIAPVRASADAAVAEQAAHAEPESEPEPEPEPEPPAPDRLDDVQLELERLNLRVDELRRLGERNMEHIDRLHDENQQLRAGELRQAMGPVLRALVRHHDNVVKMGEGSAAPELVADIRADLLHVLGIAGVEAFEPAEGDLFDPARHQGVSRAETDDASLDGTVARLRRCGFVGEDGRVIRPAEVDVYRVSGA